MKPEGYLKLVGEVRDFQIIDSEGRRCGIVDDIEFTGGAGGKLKLNALLVGPGAYRKRLPRFIAGLITAIVGDRVVRVPWQEVRRVTSVVELKRPAESYGLGKTELALERLLSKIPGATS
jgi:sporulation protein YlmC with PRC-barrel domain